MTKYNLEDKVWYIHSLNHSGLPRVIEGEVTKRVTIDQNKTRNLFYDITFKTSEHSFYEGGNYYTEHSIPEHLIYPTKEELLNSL